MTRTQIFGNRKDTRTQIADLPETSVELTEREMRIVSGGLAARVSGCGVAALSMTALMVGGVIRKDPTNYVTGRGDHDTD
jgi:hypothetical protein